jgi:hypothetical protein
MKRLLAGLAVLLVLPLLFVGCSKNYGPVTSKNYEFTDFTRVEISSAFEVEIIQSNAWSITIEAQEQLFENLNVVKTGDTLEINLKWAWGDWVSSWGFKRAKARITMPDLTGLNLSGASKGSITGFKSAHDADILVSGASTLKMDIEAAGTELVVSGASRIDGSVKATNLRMEISGASRVTLSGSADDLIVEASGASTVALEGLPAQDIDIELSGASRGTVSPGNTMKVNLSGASNLTYMGNPELEAIEISGASTIHKK